MSSYAIVPAKSRSTRLPGKNIKKIAGIPMVCRVVNTLIESALFDEVWVSTDCEDIGDVIEESGAKVLLRPESLATDRSTVNDVCLHWLDQLSKRPNIFCCTYPTSIFLTPDDYRDAYSLFDGDAYGVMGVSEYNYPPVQALSKDQAGYMKMLVPEYHKVQSQFFPECYVSNGSQYWAITDRYLEERTFYLSKLKPYVTNEEHILDINYPEDYDQALIRAKKLGWVA